MKPPSINPNPDHAGESPPREGVLIRAENGDVVTFDETGLTLRLSDRVIRELRSRLGLGVRLERSPLLGDVDAWDLREENGWLRFTGRLDPALGPRAYRKSLSGGDIVADAQGPVLAILSIGGQRRSGFSARKPEFPFHVLAPGDDIGATGYEGTGAAFPVTTLQHVPWATRDALIAEALLSARAERGRSLPLFVVRTETDATSDVADLSEGAAFRNFVTAAENLVHAARTLGTEARVVAVGIDFGLEDRESDAEALAQGLLRLMARIETALARLDLGRPVFLVTAEAGTATETGHPAIAAHGILATWPTEQRLVIPAPAYMFDQTRWGRPTDAARADMARMDALALTEALARRDWFCPTFLLAEAQGRELRVTARAMGDLVLSDALDPGPGLGFSIAGTDRPARIIEVAIADDDPQALILLCDAPLSGPSPELRYAFGAPATSPRDVALPPNRGGVRDGWSSPAHDPGRTLHRWALPAILPIRMTA